MVNNSNFAVAEWPSAGCLRGVAGTEKDFHRSVSLDIPMSPGTSSVSDEANTLDWSHLHSLKGTCENSFSVPATPRRQPAEGHSATAKFELIILNSFKKFNKVI
ncbi:hypothetical protein CE91St57_01880 [Lachnospiraceae bacterium]|nr:hypothetical protein CE91St57_01880 [Lachnospiraceae bacterium]